jgi:hypothetical protein
MMAALSDFQQAELAYVNKLRASIHTLSSDRVDDYRRMGEASGADIVLGDMTGDELADLCEDELAGRCAAAVAAGRRPSDHFEPEAA